MPTLVLLRHGRTKANASGLLAGWTPGVVLDEKGEEQAAAVARRLHDVPLAQVVTSPLERCRQTSGAVCADRAFEPTADDRFGECHYGDWTGKPIKDLSKDPLWKVVQQHPSAVVFPGEGGEALATTQSRAVAAVREWDAKVAAEHGPDAVWLACSHGDVIKAILADALGLHLDLFQRIVVDPCSVSVVRYTDTRPFVARVNDIGGDLAGLIPPPKGRSRSRKGGATAKSAGGASDAVVGGGAG
jgi:probable phosphomutase (TIGR03848 family)